MTSEDDFQRALDANPSDHTLRMVFADWLQEHDDPRAAGYRALGIWHRRASIFCNCRFYPDTPEGRKALPPDAKPFWCWWQRYGFDMEDRSEMVTDELSEDWWQLVDAEKFSGYGKSSPTRREAEDAAALAFARLPAERQRELLEGVSA